MFGLFENKKEIEHIASVDRANKIVEALEDYCCYDNCYLPILHEHSIWPDIDTGVKWYYIRNISGEVVEMFETRKECDDFVRGPDEAAKVEYAEKLLMWKNTVIGRVEIFRDTASGYSTEELAQVVRLKNSIRSSHAGTITRIANFIEDSSMQDELDVIDALYNERCLD